MVLSHVPETLVRVRPHSVLCVSEQVPICRDRATTGCRDADAHLITTVNLPLCSALHLGGMPRIEEYLDGQGYRFTWEARTLQKTRLFSNIYRWNKSSISGMLLEACSAPCDVLTAPLEQVRSVLVWLKTLPDPEKEEGTMLSESTMDAMSQCNTPQPGFVWCGYAWKSSCPLLGQVLVAIGITFPSSSICSPSLLVACWRQIACQIEGVLAC